MQHNALTFDVPREHPLVSARFYRGCVFRFVAATHRRYTVGSLGVAGLQLAVTDAPVDHLAQEGRAGVQPEGQGRHIRMPRDNAIKGSALQAAPTIWRARRLSWRAPIASADKVSQSIVGRRRWLVPERLVRRTRRFRQRHAYP